MQLWPALVAGVALVVLGVWLWAMVSRATVSQALLAELPADSRIAGVAKLAAFDVRTVEQVSQSATLYPAGAKSLVAAIRDAATPELIGAALGAEVAFAETDGHGLAVVAIRDRGAFEELAGKVSGRLADLRSVRADSAERGSVTLFSGTLPESRQAIFAYREGNRLFLATDREVLLGALVQKTGFDANEAFADVSAELPGGADAYVFLAGALTDHYPRLNFDLVGMAIENGEDRLRVTAVSADPPKTAVSPPRTSGDLLPSTELATLGVSGTDVVSYLRLLEGQRSAADLPEVIKLQNGIASLDRRLGVDLEADYLSAATGRFTYARYAEDGRKQWMALAEFDGPEIARTKVESFEQLARQKLTVPVRREVVKVLPDGSRSREIESEKQERLSIRTVTVEGRPAKTTKLPSLGTIVWQVRDSFLLVGSSDASLARLVRTLGNPGADVDERGQLAIRLDLSAAKNLTGGEDIFYDWILATRPAEGVFTLDKRTGELSGNVTFAER